MHKRCKRCKAETVTALMQVQSGEILRVRQHTTGARKPPSALIQESVILQGDVLLNMWAAKSFRENYSPASAQYAPE